MGLGLIRGGLDEGGSGWSYSVYEESMLVRIHQFSTENGRDGYG